MLVLGTASVAFAADYQPKDPDDQGKTEIVGGDTLTFSEDTVWANLTARWGVKVIFQDSDEYGNTVFKEEILPVTDNENANTTAPEDPSHDGATFTGWTRVDSNNGTSELGEDGSVTGINGPGPIIYQAEYSTTPEEPATTEESDNPEALVDPDDPSEPAKGDAPKTGDSNTIMLWLVLMLASMLAITVLVMSRKKKGLKKTIQMMLVIALAGCIGIGSLGTLIKSHGGFIMNIPSSIKFRSVVLFALLVLGILSVTVLAVNADQSIVSYTMTYLPGTSDTVTNMPANETDLIPGSSSPYTVSSVVPLREGFEFVGWSLTWGISTDYTVRYLDRDTGEPVAPDRVVRGLEVGTSVTERAIAVDGYKASLPRARTITLAESGNVIIFYYNLDATDG